MGDVWDVANAALFLASAEARYITGQKICGGLRYNFHRPCLNSVNPQHLYIAYDFKLMIRRKLNI